MDPVRAHIGFRHGGAFSVGRRGRTIVILVTMLLAPLQGTAAGISSDRSSEGPWPNAETDACSGLALNVVTGIEELTREAEPSMPGIEMHVTGDPSPTESIVFVVSLPDGPMPPLRERLMAIEGKPHGRAAILLTRADDVSDPELTALILQETRELLANHGQPDADTMPAFLDNDPNIDLLLRGLAVSP